MVCINDTNVGIVNGYSVIKETVLTFLIPSYM